MTSRHKGRLSASIVLGRELRIISRMLALSHDILLTLQWLVMPEQLSGALWFLLRALAAAALLEGPLDRIGVAAELPVPSRTHAVVLPTEALQPRMFLQHIPRRSYARLTSASRSQKLRLPFNTLFEVRH